MAIVVAWSIQLKIVLVAPDTHEDKEAFGIVAYFYKKLTGIKGCIPVVHVRKVRIFTVKMWHTDFNYCRE